MPHVYTFCKGGRPPSLINYASNHRQIMAGCCCGVIGCLITRSCTCRVCRTCTKRTKPKSFYSAKNLTLLHCPLEFFQENQQRTSELQQLVASQQQGKASTAASVDASKSSSSTSPVTNGKALARLQELSDISEKDNYNYHF